MQKIKILSIAALMIVAAGAAPAQGAIRGEGVVIGVNTPGDATADSYTVEKGATVASTLNTPRDVETLCGRTFAAGQNYPMLMISAPGVPKTQVFIRWEPKPEQDAAKLLTPGTYAITARGGNPTLRPCDTITMEWGPPIGEPHVIDVTVNIRGSDSVGVFNYQIPN